MEHHGATGPSVPPGRWWGPLATSTATTNTVANADVMNQLCRVCGEPAAGFHFGAFTCEGCKSFFGRTYNNLNSVSECKNNGECVINKKNRTSCKACRLRKCLLVGMSKSGSRYGRRSNWFKIHCLLQEQQQQQQQFQQLPTASSTTSRHLALHRQHYFPAGVPAGGGNDIPIPKPAGHPPLWLYNVKDPSSALFMDLDNNNPPSASPFYQPSTGAFGGVWPGNFATVPLHVSSSADNISDRTSLPPSSYFVSPFFRNFHHPSSDFTLPLLPISNLLSTDFTTSESRTSSISAAVLTSPASRLPSAAVTSTSSTITTIPEDKDESDGSLLFLNKLKSLGPVQECPIDLSAGGAIKSKNIAVENSVDNIITTTTTTIDNNIDANIDNSITTTNTPTNTNIAINTIATTSMARISIINKSKDSR